MNRLLPLAALWLLTACASSPRLAPAPWNAHPSIPAPQVLLDEWRGAENRAICAPLTFARTGTRTETGSPRRANFSGGWAVAWDVPGLPGRSTSGSPCAACGRGVFGIAGTGVSSGGAEAAATLPFRKEWQDGSVALYGPEGGAGPSWLAQLRVGGQGCLYNVWSFLGRDHLEELLEELRRARH